MTAPAIHFAQIREDATVERAAVAARTHRARRIVAVASGGCTALELLDDDVEVVWAVDANPAQIALVDLRKASIAALDRAAYLHFIGDRDMPALGRQRVYDALAGALPEASRRFWDERRDDIAAGVQHCGTTERFYRFVGGNLRRSVLGDAAWEALWACTTLAAQRAWAERHVGSYVWRGALRVLLSRTSHLAFFPASMFAHVAEHQYGDFFAAQFDGALDAHPLAANYFLHQLLYGHYRWDIAGASPHHLTADGYATAQRNIHKLRPVTATLTALPQDVGAIDTWCLSNVFDWSGPRGAEAIVDHLTPRTDSGGAVVVARNMLADVPLPDGLARTSTPLFPQAPVDRSLLYRNVHALHWEVSP